MERKNSHFCENIDSNDDANTQALMFEAPTALTADLSVFNEINSENVIDILSQNHFKNLPRGSGIRKEIVAWKLMA